MDDKGRGVAVCQVCMHHCSLYPGQTGFCHARKNREGTIISANYGKITSMALDPVEKKPLRRFYPGSMVLSVGSYGCNLRCPFCQNFEISMDDGSVPYREITPAALAEKALERKKDGCIGVAFTYNEPLISYEFVLDTAREVHERGMKNVVVTNGSVFEKTAARLFPYIDAMNIDLKGFTEAYYKMLGGDLSLVRQFIQYAAENCHVELTNLIVPGKNDSEKEMRELSSWVASVDREIPLHVTRFFPRYHMVDRLPTDVGNVYALARIASEYLDYVYTGNC